MNLKHVSEGPVINPIAHSVALLTLVRKVASSSPKAGRLTRTSFLPWISKMSAWQMMAIGGDVHSKQVYCAKTQDIAALVLAPQGLDLRGNVSSL